jgi:hypothetical protein
MPQPYKTVAGKIVDDVAIAKTLSTQNRGVTLGDLGRTTKGDRDVDVFTRDKFEGALKKVSRRQLAKTASS